MHYKVSIFSSQDFEFFRTPLFLGPKYFVAVAISADNQFIHFNTDENLSLLCNELAQKLPPGSEIKALFDCKSKRTDWVWNSFKPLRYTGDEPQEVSIARQICEKFLELKHTERRLLAPEIDWKAENIFSHEKIISRKSFRYHYDTANPEIQKIIAEADRKKRILVHVCCGPDAAGVIGQLNEEYEVVCFWYDPNIQPKEEYELRLDAFLKVAKLKNIPTIVGEYDVDNFLDKIKGLEHTPEQGAKCSLCYDMRLERSAIEAKKQNCDLYTTTLAISPHKVQQKLKTFGDLFGKKYNIPYLARNFMKEEGFKDSVKFTHENDIYRQDYCGCWFSLHEGGEKAQRMAGEYGLTHSDIKDKTYVLPS